MQTLYAQRYRTLHDRHWWWRSREAFVLGWIERLMDGSRGRACRILDVGCGDGLLWGTLSRWGEVEGLEPDGSVVRDPRWRDRIRIAPLDRDFRAERPFDLIVMLDVLEHIADDLGALRAAWNAARPGGRLLLTVPALPWLWSRHDEANAHHRRYLRGGLRRRLIEAGWLAETVRYFFVWTVAPLVVRRLVAPARGGGSAPAVSDHNVAIPPGPINRALSVLSVAEHALSRRVRWPVGSSLVAVARRPRH